MPYLIVANRDGELDRRVLAGALTIGRSLDCDICVRDTLLSRHHCRIEPLGDRWIVTDLGSKNGTRLGAESITRHILSDGDVIRIGANQISFIDAPFVATSKRAISTESRPADPIEAMQGTVCGVRLFDMEEDAKISGCPIPQPKPADPQSLHEDENVRGIISGLASR